MKHIAIFASGSGTNAEQIAKYFAEKQTAKVSLILTNNKNAYVLERAKKLNIPSRIFTREEFYKSDNILGLLKENNIEMLVLAGFLWLIPDNLIKAYPNKIVNIHPALLPKYGGKGMYGSKVHEAVIEAGDKESGISIHYVNEKYDEGKIIFQAKVNIEAGDTAETLAQKIHGLEYEFFPKIVEEVIINPK